MNSKSHKIILCLTAGIIVFTAGVLFGRSGEGTILVDTDQQASAGEVRNLYKKSKVKSIDFEQFWDIWETIQESYVDGPVDEQKLYHGAVKGLVEAVGDPYSIYFPPVEAEEFAADLSGEFEGIGAEIGIRDEQLMVVSPLPESPAEQAGLKAQDKILFIDEVSTQGLTVTEAVNNIRGEKGSTVTLSVLRDGEEDLLDIVITRDVINIPTVITERYENGTAYVRLTYFNENIYKDFDKVIREFQDSKEGLPTGIILDLRGNPGGFLENSVLVASEWVLEGNILEEKFGDGNIRVYSTKGPHRLRDVPTVILIDNGSASASEIVAGALRDQSQAILIGQQSFGKGSVQNFEEFGDNSALKLTIAKWFTPNGHGIDGEGLTPDIIVDPMIEVNKDVEDGYIDFGIEKAQEVIEKIVNNKFVLKDYQTVSSTSSTSEK